MSAPPLAGRSLADPAPLLAGRSLADPAPSLALRVRLPILRPRCALRPRPWGRPSGGFAGGWGACKRLTQHKKKGPEGPLILGIANTVLAIVF